MEASDALRGQVVDSAAEVYERFFVPSLFAQWAGPLIDAAGVGVGDRVLDVGCGTGVVARAALGRVGDSGEVVGVDRNEAMLAVARRTPGVVWQEGLAEALPFDADRFDRVLSAFVLMFVDDRRQVVREMGRVLAPEGTVAVATWAEVGESPGYSALVDILADVVGEAAADALRAPFSLGTVGAVEASLTEAFAEVSVAQYQGAARFESLDAWMHTEIRGWTLADAIDDATYGRLLDAARVRLGDYVDGSGRVEFTAPAIIGVAARPRTR